VSGLDDFDRVPDAKQVREALEEVSVPSFAVDRDGVIRWVNKAAIELVGDPRGRLYTSVVPAHLVPRARERFASIVVGGRARDLDSELMAADGSRLHIGLSAVPLRNGEVVVGLFGQAFELPRRGEAPKEPPPHLTPRQFEIVRLLADGMSTRAIATQLGIKPQTVKAHIRGLLRALRVNSRLEAVAAARRDGLLRDLPQRG
jgi:DNA-binding CsgD family transcriptional regulator